VSGRLYRIKGDTRYATILHNVAFTHFVTTLLLNACQHSMFMQCVNMFKNVTLTHIVGVGEIRSGNLDRYYALNISLCSKALSSDGCIFI